MTGAQLLGYGLIASAAALWVLGRRPDPERHPDTLSPWTIVAALVLPVAGVIITIVLLAQGRGAHGAAVLLTTVVGAFIGAAIWL